MKKTCIALCAFALIAPLSADYWSTLKEYLPGFEHNLPEDIAQEETEREPALQFQPGMKAVAICIGNRPFIVNGVARLDLIKGIGSMMSHFANAIDTAEAKQSHQRIKNAIDALVKKGSGGGRNMAFRKAIASFEKTANLGDTQIRNILVSELESIHQTIKSKNCNVVSIYGELLGMQAFLSAAPTRLSREFDAMMQRATVLVKSPKRFPTLEANLVAMVKITKKESA